MGTKICSRCSHDKPRDAFAKNAAKADGLQSICRQCMKSLNAASYERNKSCPRATAQRKAAYDALLARNRQYVGEYLRRCPCVDCGEADPVVLQFDHQGDKVADIANLLNRASLKRLVAEIAKCEVVCANCHSRRTAKAFGWWKCGLTPVVA